MAGVVLALAGPVFGQAVADPFTHFGGLTLEGRIQRMVASRDYLIIHRVVGPGTEIVECLVEGQLTLGWRKAYVSVGEEIVLQGDRVAFMAAESQPAANSMGLHILNARTGERVAYGRSGILGRAGRFLAVAGDRLLDMADGSEVFGHVFNVRHVRFLATIGDKFLLLVSQAADWNARRPVLYDPIGKTDLWASRTFSAEMVEFLDKRIGRGRTDKLDYEGFPVLLAEDVQSLFGPAFKFMLLQADGRAIFLGRADFGLSEPKPFATVDFSYIWNSPNGLRLIAGINTRHIGKIDGEKIIIAVFDAAGAKLAQTVLDPKTDPVAWTGLDPAGRLLAFVNRHGPRPRDFIVSFALPSLARTQIESAFNAQVNSPPGLIDGKLFFWDQEEIYAPGAKIPPRAKTRRPLVAALDSVSGAVSAYYPFDDSTWDLMSYARDRIRHIHNDVHLFLPFRSADRSRNASLLLPIPRLQSSGWLNATFSVTPSPVYPDSDATISYTPAGASVSISTGRLDGRLWHSPPHPDTTWATVSLGGLSQMFEVPLRARPVNQPPVARFKVPPRAENAQWDVPVVLDASASSDPDGRIVSYSWRFNRVVKDYPATSPLFSHEFAGSGAQEATLTVTDDKGATGSLTRIVNVPKTISYGGTKRSGPVSVGLAKQAGYDIEITTGTPDGAGTDAWVYVSLYGPLNADGERTGTTEFALYNAISEANDDPFESGRTDVFRSHQGQAVGIADSSSLDKIEFITLRHDDTGNRPDWHVKSVKIRNQSNGMEWYFEPNDWLDWSKGSLKAVWGKFTPAPGDYPRGVLFGGVQRSWDMTEASDNIFILKAGADKLYFTSLDRANQIEVYRDGVMVGRQYARGSGLVTAPYITRPEFGIEYQASQISRPTKFTVQITHPDSSRQEAFVWIFPSNWAGYAGEARRAALVYPLKGSTSFFQYGDEVRRFMGSVYTFETSLHVALNVVMGYAGSALGIFGGPGDDKLKGTIEEKVGLYVSKGLNGVLKLMGLTLANSIFNETIGLFESMIKARAWAEQLGSVQASAAAAAGALQYLGRLANCSTHFLQAVWILDEIKNRLDRAVAALDANDPASFAARMAEIRTLAVGDNPDGVLVEDYVIDYAVFGVSDPGTGSTPQDNYCLSLACLLEYNNIQRWKTGNEIGPCFPSNALIGWTDAEKKAETQAAMTTYEPLFKNIMMVAGVAISIALLD